MQGPDPELAERFRTGDDSALRGAYDRYGGAVFHLAARSLANRADAEDVTQATFVAAWLGRETFDPERGSLLGWLLGIARRKVVDRLRIAARENRATETVRALPEPPEPIDSPDRVLDRLVVADELAQLPSEQRRTLELAFFDDLTHPQISAVTGCRWAPSRVTSAAARPAKPSTSPAARHAAPRSRRSSTSPS